MELNHTTILPTDDAELARTILTTLISDQPLVLLLVFGTSERRKQIVQTGDKLCGHEGSYRRVVWVRQPDDVRQVLYNLKDPNHYLNETVEAVSLSLSDTVRDGITPDDPVDFVRVFMAFVNAEAASQP